MAKIIRTLGNPASQQSLQAVVETMAKQFGAHISFGNASGLVFGNAATNTVANQDQTKNLDCWVATGTTQAVGVAFTVTHNLPRVPIGFIVIRLNQNEMLADTGVPWTAATNTTLGTISLAAQVSGVTKFTIIII